MVDPIFVRDQLNQDPDPSVAASPSVSPEVKFVKSPYPIVEICATGRWKIGC